MKLTYMNDDALELSVEFDRWDCPPTGWDVARAQWRWSIDCAGENIASAADLRSGANGKADPVDALRSLASFLGAWAESSEDGENADLFPASMRELGIDWQAFADEMSASLDPDMGG